MSVGRSAGTRRRVLLDRLRTELWPLPAAAITLAIGLGVAMPRVDARLLDDLPPTLAVLLFSGGPEAARSVLQTVAGSLITVTSLTFSLTLVTLQLASGQYSPRLLRTFARDRVVHATLAVLLATFSYSLTVLRTVRTGDEQADGFVPRLSITTAYVLTLVSVLAVVGFLAHLAQQIRVESMLRDVHADGGRTIRATVPEASDEPVPAPDLPPDEAGVRLCARRSGFLASVDEQQLLKAARRTGTVIRIDRHPGASIIAGTPIATAWPVDRPAPDDADRHAWEKDVDAAIHLSFERTATQDVAFALRQITDVAAKALSPGVNDPTTAVHALSHAAALLCQAAGHEWAPHSRCDDTGRTRVVLTRPSFGYLLRLVVDQPRRYGAGEPAVLARLLQLLREVAWVARTDEHRSAVATELARTRATVAAQDLDEVDRSELARGARRVECALDGRWASDE